MLASWLVAIPDQKHLLALLMNQLHATDVPGLQGWGLGGGVLNMLRVCSSGVAHNVMQIEPVRTMCQITEKQILKIHI